MNPRVFEKDGNLICEKHNAIIIAMILDNQIPFSETLLCSQCFDERPSITHQIISLEQAQAMIDKKYVTLDSNKEVRKHELLYDIQNFSQKMMEARSELILKFDEILKITSKWIADIQNFGKKPDQVNLIAELEELYMNTNVKNIEENILEKIKRSYLMKINLPFQKLFNTQSFQDCYQKLRDIEENEQINQNDQNEVNSSYQILKDGCDSKKIIQSDCTKVETFSPINCKLIQSVQQNEYCFSISFNNSGSIMAAGCNEDIKIWRFDQENLIEEKILKGHTQNIACLVFSKKHNWFASGSYDHTIRSWKEQDNNDWVSSEPQEQHIYVIQCLILSNSEDQLISCGLDGTIKVWNIDYEMNLLNFAYEFEKKHRNSVYCASFNEQESQLITCSCDKQIILWVKGHNNKWDFSTLLAKDDYGYRIGFINDNQIAWQQQSEGLTHIFEIKNGNLKEKMKIKLKHATFDLCFFPTIYNKNKNVIIQKHNQHKEQDWMSVESQHKHKGRIQCLILNQNEDQLLSGGYDETIKVWTVNCEQNEITLYYVLENKHTDEINSISMNESETALVSCSEDKKIILWLKGLNEKWEYKSHLTFDDEGQKICFISDNQISWQQESQGITHIFEIENENLIEKPELKTILNERYREDQFFPTIFNKSKQVMIQKYNRFVYIIRKQNNGQFKIVSKPIDCNDCFSYGALTEDGEYLVIWNISKREFRVYKITYDE